MLIACIPARNLFDLLFPRAVAVVSKSDEIRGVHIENKERVSIKKKHATMISFNHSGIPTDHSITGDVQGGHWEYVQDTTPPYIFSKQVCKASFIHEDDCVKAEKYCPSNLMNWIYKDKNNNPYPRFDVDGFRRNMRNSRIIFVGSSLVRQQVQALVWTLGHNEVKWENTDIIKRPWYSFFKWTKSSAKCTSNRVCMLDAIGNITICHRFMGSMATKIYRQGNFKLDHRLRGYGDSSCLLHDKMIVEFDEFDLAFVQGSVAWFAGLPENLNSSSSPFEWVERMVPELYHDAMDTYLSKVSRRTKTVFVLGQTGTSCANKNAPEPFSVDNIPHSYGWNIGPKLWNVSLTLIRENEINVQVIDAREPLMQSVHAHPVLSPQHDCVHFCMSSSAINMYLNMYWAQVFSQYTKQS